MIHRDDLRLAVCVALAAGFGSISTVPDGYYLPLTLAAVMVGSYGSSYELGLQRVVCTLLGGLCLLIVRPAFGGLPVPIGLAMILGLIRFLGGCLGLEAGYKVAGMVVVMGWLMQPMTVDTWLGLKLSWTALGVVMALLGLHLFWPNTAIRDHQRAYVALLDLLREALLEQQQLLLVSGDFCLSPALRKQRHRELMRALFYTRSMRSSAVLELGSNPYGQSQAHLWSELERCCAAIAGCITAMRALREPLNDQQSLIDLNQTAAHLLANAATQVSHWQAALQSDRPMLSPDATTHVINELIERMRISEQVLLSQVDLPLLCNPFQLRQLARRLLLCYQVAALVQRMQQRWQELIPLSFGHKLLPGFR